MKLFLCEECNTLGTVEIKDGSIVAKPCKCVQESESATNAG
jgi:hypothetical protein